ncbi:hypothetical protein K9L97_03850 [Candidatus Woesearchaeota archaeon]|nr:hypothetical protein [Candidatus Woesearchaeota archaeon]
MIVLLIMMYALSGCVSGDRKQEEEDKNSAENIENLLSRLPPESIDNPYRKSHKYSKKIGDVTYSLKVEQYEDDLQLVIDKRNKSLIIYFDYIESGLKSSNIIIKQDGNVITESRFFDLDDDFQNKIKNQYDFFLKSGVQEDLQNKIDSIRVAEQERHREWVKKNNIKEKQEKARKDSLFKEFFYSDSLN